MRHSHGYRKLNRTHEHRGAMFANMVCSLIEHEQIKTTLPKAKELKPIIEKYITLAKKGDLHSRRQVLKKIPHKPIVKELFDNIAPECLNRNGGYTRIIKLGFRDNDCAPVSLIEFVDVINNNSEKDENKG